MAKTENHFEQWVHNRDFLKTIDSDYPDWLATVTLYTAIHAVETLFKADGLRGSNSHGERKMTLNQQRRYQKLQKHCHIIDNYAGVLRYSCQFSEISNIEVRDEIIRKHLYPLEQSVLKLLGKMSKSPVKGLPSKLPDITCG